jgi:hypothetical protein
MPTLGGVEEIYRSEWQGVWALLPVPALFLAWVLSPAGRRRAARGGDARFVWRYSVCFAALTMLDPVAGGPLARGLGLSPPATTSIAFWFVLLGDFRVFALVFGLADERRGRFARAAAFALLVPLVDLVLFFGLLRGLWPAAPDQWMWLIHELAFLALALWLRGSRLPALAAPEPAGHQAYLRRALAYAATYYGLWAAADVLILLHIEVGWLLRIVPNQLYYAFWVPFVFLSFRFSAPRADRASAAPSR